MKKLEVNNLQFAYKKDSPIFNNVGFNFSCPDQGGFIVSLMGPSGAGKSTLLKLILGMLKPDNGSMEITPENTVISYVPQEDILFEHLGPMENAAYFKHATTYRNRFDQHALNEVAEALNMTEVLNNRKRVDQLSGGEKQRLALLRALSINPDVLLLDEPCTGLDSEVKHAFLLKLRELSAKYNLLVIYVTHHLDEAKMVSDQIAYLVSLNDNGVIDRIHTAPVAEFLQTPPSIKAVQMVFFPSGVLLNGNIVNSKIELTENGNKYILVREQNIRVTNSEGWPFEVVTDKGIYLQLEHTLSGNCITVPNIWLVHDKKVFIDIKGNCPIYNCDGVFETELNF